jgi:ABC-type multidrug transport system fused ATPase/permease subunit
MSRKYKALTGFMPFYRQYKSQFIALGFVMLMASSLGMLYPRLMSQITIGITGKDSALMVSSALWFMLLVFVHHSFWFLWGKFGSSLNNRVAFDVKQKIIESFLNTKYAAAAKNTSGYYLERLNDDTTEVSAFLSNLMGTLVDLLTNVGFMVYVFILNWQCGIIFTIGVAILYCVQALKIRRNLRLLKNIKGYKEKSNSLFSEAVASIKDIKTLGIKTQIENVNNAINHKLAKEQAKQYTVSEFIDRIYGLVRYGIDTALVIACALWLFPANQIEVITILIIFNFKGSIYEMMGFFAKIKNYFVQGDYQAGRILEVISLQTAEVETFGSRALTDKFGIEIEGLSFSYDDNTVLDNVSLVIPENTCTAFIGYSGSGKTTLLNCLNKLLPVENNMIKIGGTDINEVTEQSLRESIFTVNQEPFIFNDTILKNFRIVCPAATKETIFEACKKANIHAEILAMPSAYETLVAENSSNLSGGQKQRIAIARAILRNSKVILFDEPTSALDNENSANIMTEIRSLSKTRTVIVVTHKLEDIKHFDHIVVFDAGRIAGCGAHAQLFSTCEVYRKLLKANRSPPPS